MAQYHQALIKEITKFAAQCPSKLRLDTIFLGGGTPSTWPDHLLLDMFGTLNKVFSFEHDCEITIEVNPGTVRAEQLEVWKAIGINRLSIGVQGLKDSVLKNLNRQQSKNDVVWLLQEAGRLFENLSVDLILGLPGVSADEWKDLLCQAVQWPICHVSIYFLTVHEETPLYYRVKRNEIALEADEQMVALYEWTVRFLSAHGLRQYELSNFAKPGRHSRHNSVYWERKPYKGFGIGACSFDGQSRFQNQKNLTKYMADVANDMPLTIFAETLTDQQVCLEKIMLGLRRAQGISLHELTAHLNAEQKQHIRATIEILRSAQLLQKENDTIVLTAAGLAVQNDIAARLSL